MMVCYLFLVLLSLLGSRSPVLARLGSFLAPSPDAVDGGGGLSAFLPRCIRAVPFLAPSLGPLIPMLIRLERALSPCPDGVAWRSVA